MRTKNVQLELDLSDVWSIDRSHVKRDEQYLNEGDLLISSANSWNLVGKCAWVPALECPSTFGGFVTALRPNRERLDSRYLYRFFSSARIQAAVRGLARQTTNIANLDLKRCSALLLPLPPIDEQRRIAAILDHTDALRAKRREALARLDELTQSIFIDMFGDPTVNPMGWARFTLGEICADRFRNGLSPSTSGSVSAKVLTLSAVTGSGFDGSAFKFSTFNSVPPAGQSVSSQDLLICRGNGNLGLVGRGYFAPHALPDVTFPDTIIAATVDLDRCDKAFLEHVWNTRMVRFQIESAARTTNGTFKINQTMLREIEFPLPDLGRQREFGMRKAYIDSMRGLHRTALSELDALFVSLQARAFRGEL